MKTVDRSVDESPAVLEERELERLHREGYETYPVEPGEFSDWEDEQAWTD